MSQKRPDEALRRQTPDQTADGRRRSAYSTALETWLALAQALEIEIEQFLRTFADTIGIADITIETESQFKYAL